MTQPFHLRITPGSGVERYEYQMYDVVHKKKMDIRERPLIVMECSVIGKAYLNFFEGFTHQALQTMKHFRGACQNIMVILGCFGTIHIFITKRPNHSIRILSNNFPAHSSAY